MLSPITEAAMDIGKVLAHLRRECADLQRQCFAAAPPLTTEKHMPAPKLRRFAGLNIMVENPAGSIRSGVNKSGKRWFTRMRNDYGYLKKHNGEDGEGLDIFIGPDPNAHNVYVVHQNDPETGSYDEDKVVVGCHSPGEAKSLYLSNYDTPKFFRSITEIPLNTFKAMLTKAQPGSVHWKMKHARAHQTTAMFSDFDDGSWITIGAQTGADGKKHGGSPVKVGRGGQIEAGPAKLKGRNLQLLKSKLKPAKNPHSMTGTQTSTSRGRDGSRNGEKSEPVRVDQDLRQAAQLGRLTIPLKAGELDQHLEDAYRREAEKQGVKLGEFKINPDSGHATAQVGDDHPGGEPVHNPELDADLMARHPLHDTVTGNVVGEPAPAHQPPQNDKELAQAVARGDIPVKDILQTHPHLAGPALVEQHRQQAKAEIAARQAEADAKAQAAQQQPSPSPGVPAAGQMTPELREKMHQRVKELRDTQGMPTDRATARARMEMEKEGLIQPTPAAEKPQRKPVPQPAEQAPKPAEEPMEAGSPEYEAALAARTKDSDAAHEERMGAMGSALDEVKGLQSEQQDLKGKLEAAKEPEQEQSTDNPQAETWKRQEIKTLADSMRETDPDIGLVEARAEAKRLLEQEGSVSSEIREKTADLMNAAEAKGKKLDFWKARAQAKKLAATPKAEGDRPVSSETLPRQMDLPEPADVNGNEPTSAASENPVNPDASAAREAAQRPAAKDAVASKSSKPMSKSAIERTLLDHLNQTGGGYTVEDEKALHEAAGAGDPFTFHGKLPTEVKEFMAGRPEMRKLFKVSNDTRAAGGADAFAQLGDRYLDIAGRKAGGSMRQAIEAAKKSPDPQMRFLAALHETMPAAKDRNAEAVDPATLQPGEEMTVHGFPYEVKETPDGERILQDHGNLPDVPVDALTDVTIPVDKGSRREGSWADLEDPFGDLLNEPEPAELEPNEAVEQPTAQAAGPNAQPTKTTTQAPLEPIRTSKQLGLLGPMAGQEIGNLTGSQKSMFEPQEAKPAAGNGVDDRIARQYDPESTPTFDKLQDVKSPAVAAAAPGQEPSKSEKSTAEILTELRVHNDRGTGKAEAPAMLDELHRRGVDPKDIARAIATTPASKSPATAKQPSSATREDINKAIAATSAYGAEKWLTDKGIPVTDEDRDYLKTRQDAVSKASLKPIAIGRAHGELRPGDPIPSQEFSRLMHQNGMGAKSGETRAIAEYINRMGGTHGITEKNLVDGLVNSKWMAGRKLSPADIKRALYGIQNGLILKGKLTDGQTIYNVATNGRGLGRPPSKITARPTTPPAISTPSPVKAQPSVPVALRSAYQPQPKKPMGEMSPTEVNLAYRRPFDRDLEAKLDRQMERSNIRLGPGGSLMHAIARGKQPSASRAGARPTGDIGKLLRDSVQKIQAESAKQNRPISFDEAMKLARKKNGMDFDASFAALDAVLAENLRIVDQMLARSAVLVA